MLRQRTESQSTSGQAQPDLAKGRPLYRAIALALACGLILGGVWFISGGETAETSEPLFGERELSAERLKQIESAFQANGLTDWKREGSRLFIPAQARRDYLSALEHSAMVPFAGKSRVEQALEDGGFLEPESQRKKRYEVAKARDLGNKVTAFGDIASASVEHDYQNTGGFDQQVIQSASVVLIPKNDQPLPPGRIRMIQDFVAAAYAGMDADQVTVTDTSAGKTYCGSDDLESRERRQAEYDLEQRLAELLDGYKGLRIGVKSIDVSALRTSQPDHPLANNQNSASERPDDAPNRQHQPLAMRVSIGVPESQFHRQWITNYRARHPGTLLAPAPDKKQLDEVSAGVIDNIRDAVSPFVAIGRDADAISVWSFPDSKANPQYAAETVMDPRIEFAIDYGRRNATFLAPIAALILIALGFAVAAGRMRLKSSPAPRASEAQVQSSQSSHTDSFADSPRQRNHQSTDPNRQDNTSLKEDLAELVESNPELAAQIVHSWISRAA